jgi:hypothetical protein
MALTYRQTKGSALTIQELDANFEYFTGSHAITGSLTVSGSVTSSLVLFNVPEYIDQDAAIAAGLTAGMIFRNENFLMIVTGSQP